MFHDYFLNCSLCIFVCCRNLANHLYAKVYETQEDLCRKRNEIRVANLQLSAVRTQVGSLPNLLGFMKNVPHL